jgi:hypothetical protein
MIWRIVTSEHMRGQSYAEICSSWTLDAVDDANAILDAYDVAIAALQPKAGQ